MKEMKSKTPIKLGITEKVLGQIAFLHNQCPTGREWSGLLVYKVVSGTIEKPETLELETLGIYPMDFGEAAFTSFEGDEKWIKAFTAFPQINPMSPTPGHYVGKIHSHHFMGSFHSVTDDADLKANCSKLPVFLSVVVNYAMEFNSKLAIHGNEEEVVLTRSVFSLKGWLQKTKNVTRETRANELVYILEVTHTVQADDYLVKATQELQAPPVSGFPHIGFKQQDALIVKGLRKRDRKAIMGNITNLLTLGTRMISPIHEIADQLVDAMDYKSSDDYKKALQVYFVETWFPKIFPGSVITESECLGAILEVLQSNQSWATRLAAEGLTDLKTRLTTNGQLFPEPHAIHESALV
jgi:hypothetical protein